MNSSSSNAGIKPTKIHNMCGTGAERRATLTVKSSYEHVEQEMYFDNRAHGKWQKIKRNPKGDADSSMQTFEECRLPRPASRYASFPLSHAREPLEKGITRNRKN